MDMDTQMKRLAVLIGWLVCASLALAQGPRQSVVVIFDGLRPDYLTPERMPRLYALKQRAAYAAHNHSVFPTVTRVNSSSYATGSYPKTHGILGNTIHVPTLGNSEIYNTGERSNMQAVDSLSGGRLLTTVSVGEVLAEQGKRLYVFSSGSSGQAFLQNHRANGAVVHPEFIVPGAVAASVRQALGEAGDREGKFAKHAWITDAFLRFGLVGGGPEVCSVWYSEPDAIQHATGIGSAASLEAARVMDDQLGRILDAIDQRGMAGQVDLVVTSDHGFITYGGDHTVREFLIAEGFKRDRESDDVIVADGAIFVKGGDADVTARIVAALQRQPWVGPIFTRAHPEGGDRGAIPGTLSQAVVHWNHPERAADILVAYDWNDAENEYGYPGKALNKSPIAAGHGGISRYEIKTPMVLWGPSFKPAYVSGLPSSFIDIMPTLLALHGIEKPSRMDGRVLTELLAGQAGSKPPIATVEEISNRVSADWGTYEVTVQTTTVNGFRYVDFGTVGRTGN